MDLNLTPQQLELVLRILEQRHEVLLKEIWHTDNRDFKHALQHEEKLLESILQRMREEQVQTARM